MVEGERACGREVCWEMEALPGVLLCGRVEEKAGALGQSWKMIKTHTGGDT